MTEKLTDGQRAILVAKAPVTGPKALRLLDAATARVAELEVDYTRERKALHRQAVEAQAAANAANARIAELWNKLHDKEQEVDAANARADAAEKRTAGLAGFHCERSSESRDALEKAESESAALRAQLEETEDALNGARLDLQMNDEAHESEAASLRAELTELNGELARMQKTRNDAIVMAERFRAKHEECNNCELIAALRAEVERLRDGLRIEEEETERLQNLVANERAAPAPSERAAAERLRTERDWIASELAAATALLERCWDEWGSNTDGADDHVTQRLARDLGAYLDAPAPVSSERTMYEVIDPRGNVVHATHNIEVAAADAQRMGPEHTWRLRSTPEQRATWRNAAERAPSERAAAEQCVLDVCARAEFITYDGRECIIDEDFAIGDAVLALRAVKP